MITLSEDGIAIFDNKLRRKATVAREVYDVTGAGDTVLASIGFALACNLDIDEAIDFTNLAAGIVVGKLGCATATVNEIIEYRENPALVFGRENYGLYKEELALCEVTLTIPTNPDYPILNLSQAVGIVLYEIKRKEKVNGPKKRKAR